MDVYMDTTPIQSILVLLLRVLCKQKLGMNRSMMEQLPGVACSQAMAAAEIGRGYETMTQLRALVLLCPRPADGRWSEIAGELAEMVLNSLTSAGSLLRPCSCCPAGIVGSPCSDDSDRSRGSDDKMRNKDIRGSEMDESPKGHRRRRRAQHCTTTITSVPHVDGYQWRKYGEKKIKDAKFTRNYYRCTHHEAQQCPATKTVQEQESSNEYEHPPKYLVCYRMEHSCRDPKSTTRVEASVPILESNNGQRNRQDQLDQSSDFPQHHNYEYLSSLAGNNHQFRDMMLSPAHVWEAEMGWIMDADWMQ